MQASTLSIWIEIYLRLHRTCQNTVHDIPYPRMMWFCLKGLQEAWKWSTRSGPFELPTVSQKFFLWDHVGIGLVDMLPYITFLYWGVRRLGFLVQQEFKTYLYTLKLGLDWNFIFFLLSNLIFFPLSPLVGLAFLFFEEQDTASCLENASDRLSQELYQSEENPKSTKLTQGLN